MEECRRHRNLLEIRKREIEKELEATNPLRQELAEIEALLHGYDLHQEHVAQEGGHG